LAEQRRILAEEYRLLRMQRSGAAAVSAGGIVRPHAPSSRPAPERFAASRPGFWAWLKRVATGGTHRAVEGN
jgi:hypothetical protein